MRSHFRFWSALVVCAVLAACGGGGGSSGSSTPTQQNTTIQGGTSITQVIASPGANAAQITVAQAPAPANVVVANVPMISVTLCSPAATTQCVTIPNIQVDTGSSGLRVLASVLPSAFLTGGTALPQVQAPAGAGAMAECMTFADGIAFGSVRQANVTIASESASNLNIEVIGDTQTVRPVSGQTNGNGTIQTALSDCESLTNQDTATTLHANGVLGVGTAADDCYFCHSAINATPMYYGCPTASSCTNLAGVTLDAAHVIPNPVSKFAVDNNGVIVELPAVPATGAPSVSGVLVFGIGTQANNALGSAQVFTADAVYGTVTTSFQGGSYTNSFFDSGSNSLFFPAAITTCPDVTTFYCPASTQSLSAVVQGHNGVNATVNFSVANADTLTNSGNFAFNNQAGTTGAFFSGGSTFDWGLPAFYGRNVFTSIAGSTTTGGFTGPYYAF